jgi:protein transport protein YIF1
MSKIQSNPFSHLENTSLPSFGGLKTISLDSPVTKYGIQATSAIAGSWFGDLWKKLHYYFDVSNSYVLKKLSLILAPFLSQGDWIQELGSDGLPGSARFNKHAPDLYIPLMSLITFILLSGLKSGYQGKFAPDILGFTASCSIGLIIFELLIIYGGFYFLQSALPSILDLLSYCSYKFVPCVLIEFLNILVGTQAYFIVFLYSSVMFGLFLVFFT